MSRSENLSQGRLANFDYIFNPELGNKPGKRLFGPRFEALREDRRCRGCGAGAKSFRSLAQKG